MTRKRRPSFTPSSPSHRRPWLGWGAVLGIVLVLLGVLGWLYARQHSASEDAVIVATPPRDVKGPSKTPGAPDCGCGLGIPETATVEDAGPVEDTVVRKEPPPGPAPAGMVWIPGGTFSMGSPYPSFADARPIHPVEVDGFWMDAVPVTNEQFAAFVRATGYITVAERKPSRQDYPDVPAHRLVPGSAVFFPTAGPVPLDDVNRWWRYVPGACWNHPEGPDSDLKDREKHPVVHVSWDDAVAYCKWVGKRLPTEAEFEYAARGGLTQKRYVWGDEFRPDGKYMANTWQGRFPYENTKEDGWERTAPVGSYSPNGFGLYDMAGNVWQWCSDWYHSEYYARSSRRNPQGPAQSYDPREPTQPKRVQRGGSFLCSSQFCSRYMPGGRGQGAVDTGNCHVGFRCVVSPANR